MEMKFVHNFVNGRDGKEAVVLYDPLLREYHVRVMTREGACVYRLYLDTEAEAMDTAEQMVQ